MWEILHLKIKKTKLVVSMKIQVKGTGTVYCQHSFRQDYKNKVLVLKKKKRTEPQAICYALLANTVSFLTSVSQLIKEA